MNKIPTLEEIAASMLYPEHEIQRALEFIEHDKQTGKQMYSMSEILRIARKVAETQVEAALKAAAEHVKLIENPTFSRSFEGGIDKDSILTAYPLTNIV